MVQIAISMTEAERDGLRHDAHRHDMNMSEYIRWLIEREHNAGKRMDK